MTPEERIAELERKLEELWQMILKLTKDMPECRYSDNIENMV